MGRNPHFTNEDYANRIMAYLYEQPEYTATTERILRDVKGTDFRLMDGIVYLMIKNSIRPTFHHKNRTTWTVTNPVKGL